MRSIARFPDAISASHCTAVLHTRVGRIDPVGTVFTQTIRFIGSALPTTSIGAFDGGLAGGSPGDTAIMINAAKETWNITVTPANFSLDLPG